MTNVSLPPFESTGSWGWLLFADAPPVDAKELRKIALEEDFDPEEADAIGMIATRYGLKDNPYIIIQEGSADDPGCLIDVIVPPEDFDILTIYNKYWVDTCD